VPVNVAGYTRARTYVFRSGQYALEIGAGAFEHVLVVVHGFDDRRRRVPRIIYDR